MACPARLQPHARLAHRQVRCLGGSAFAGRAACRCYVTVASRETHLKPQETSHPLKHVSPKPNHRRWREVAKPPHFSQDHIPSVYLPAEAAKSPTVHKIHILGDDERSRFIAHALSGVYDSVEMLNFKKLPLTGYRNISRRKRTGRGPQNYDVVPNAAMNAAEAGGDKSHIDTLFVSSLACEASYALESVKDRVDNKTDVVLMTEGLGELEVIRQRIFSGEQAEPNFFHGYMSHRLVFDRKTDAVKELKPGTLRLNWAGKDTSKLKEEVTQTRPNFIRSLQQSEDLGWSLTSFDLWLRFKLPAVLFDTVVEPTCVLLDLPYHALLQNKAAGRIMHRLLCEVADVVESLPEVEGSPIIRDYLRGSGMKRYIHKRIIGKQDQPSQLLRRIERGLPSSIDYLNGFMVRRGRDLGLGLSVNELVLEAVKAKQSRAIERLNSYVKLEDTSIPSQSFFRYRTTPE